MPNDAGFIRCRVSNDYLSSPAPSNRSVSGSPLSYISTDIALRHGLRRSSSYPDARQPNTSSDGLHASVAGLETVDLNSDHANEEQKAATLADADTMMDMACVEVVVDTDLKDVMSFSATSSDATSSDAGMDVVHVEVVVDTDLNDVMSYSTASSDAEYEYVDVPPPGNTDLRQAANTQELSHGANTAVNAGVNTLRKVAGGVVRATGAAIQRATSLAEACSEGDHQNADLRDINSALTVVGNGAQAVAGNLVQDVLSASSALARNTAGVVLKGSKQTAGFVQGLGSAENKKKGFETVNNFLTTAGETIKDGVAAARGLAATPQVVIDKLGQANNPSDGDMAVEMLDLSQK